MSTEPKSAESLLSAEVQGFLRRHIESYEQLEVLLLLCAQPDRLWSSESVASDLRVTRSAADESLRFLCRENLVRVELRTNRLCFRYGPRSPQLAGLATQFVRAYEEHRIEVMRLMTANAVERVRIKALRKFSDSFILKPKKGNDG